MANLRQARLVPDDMSIPRYAKPQADLPRFLDTYQVQSNRH